MPNWVEGDLKIRGTKDAIKKFLLEALTPCGSFGAVEETPIVKERDCSVQISLKKASCFHIKGTSRHFIEENDIWFEYPEDGDKAVMVLEFKSAWDIDAEPLRLISKEFNVDFKILGFERGMEFNRDIEIVNGEIIKNEEISFEDYEWECIRPTAGG